VRARTLADLRQCEVGSWFNAEYPDRARAEYVGAVIPTLDSVLTRYAGRARFYIEVKGGDDAHDTGDALLALLRAHRLVGPDGDAGRVIVQSFDSTVLRRLRTLEPSLPLVLLLGDDPVPPALLDATLRGIAKYAQGVGPSRRVVSARFVAAAHAAGLLVHPYTVNEPDAMRYMLGLGVDGIFTDRPAELLQISRPAVPRRAPRG
jgi:glycerophosphoryl diester phosphodiesterase